MARDDKRRRLKVPKTARRGEVVVIECLAEHVMEPGRRKHPETGVVSPRFIIKRMECRYNGELVSFAGRFKGVSANPYVSFKLSAVESGTVEVTWMEDDDSTTSASAEIEVVDSTGSRCRPRLAGPGAFPHAARGAKTARHRAIFDPRAARRGAQCCLPGS